MGNYCPNCGASITEDAKFCSNCGKSLEEVYRPVKQAATFNDKAFANQTSLELFKNAYNYEFGIGIEEDICKAAQLYYQAAEAGNSDAMCHFGYLQLYGFGVKRSTQNAMYWMQKRFVFEREYKFAVWQECRKAFEGIKCGTARFYS